MTPKAKYSTISFYSSYNRERVRGSLCLMYGMFLMLNLKVVSSAFA